MNKNEFRIWDTQEKKYIKWHLPFMGKDTELNDLFNAKGLIFQQFTSLKDKNGLKIFEGDIIKIPDCDPKEIIFEDTKFQLSTGEDLSWPHIKNDLEIIGNIFENPELLENK